MGRSLGVLATAEGRWDEAVGYLERAEAFCADKGLVVEQAHCRLALFDALRGRDGPGDRERAVSVLDQAQAEFQRLSMPFYVQRSRARR